MQRTHINDGLVVLAVVGLIAALNVVAHKNAPHFWAKLVTTIAFSAACLLCTRSKEALDSFFAVIAAFLALGAMVVTTGLRAHPELWVACLGLAGAAVLFVWLTRHKRATLLTIAAIAGFRLVVLLVLYALHQ